jgi:hypothetical protein
VRGNESPGYADANSRAVSFSPVTKEGDNGKGKRISMRAIKTTLNNFCKIRCLKL